MTLRTICPNGHSFDNSDVYLDWPPGAPHCPICFEKWSRSPTDVTDLVSFGNSDDEFLPITKCVCGAKFDLWHFIISIYSDSPTPCPSCGRLLFFSASITVYETK